MSRFTAFCAITLSAMVMAAFVLPTYLNRSASANGKNASPAPANVVEERQPAASIEERVPKANYVFAVLTAQSTVEPQPDFKARMTLGYALGVTPSQYEGTGNQRFVLKEIELLREKQLAPASGAEKKKSITAPETKQTEVNPDETWVEGC